MGDGQMGNGQMRNGQMGNRQMGDGQMENKQTRDGIRKGVADWLMIVLGRLMLLVTLIFCLLPFLLMLSASLTSEHSLMQNGYGLIPKEFSLAAYEYLVNQLGTIGHAYMITLLVTVLGVTASLILTILLGYVMARKTFPFRRFLTVYVLLTMLFNGGLVPTYLVYTQIFHIRDTLGALIVPNLLMSGFNVILVKNYFATSIPEEIYEAAQMDGGNEFKIFWHVALPMAKPILATVGLFTTLNYWNDWLNGLYYVNETRLFSIQNLLNRILNDMNYLQSGEMLMDVGYVLPSMSIRMAIAVITLLPVAVIFPFFQKYFVKGITIGSVKG